MSANRRKIKEKIIKTDIAVKDIKINQAKADLIKVSKSFYSRGWMLGTSGNLSILINDTANRRYGDTVTNFEFLITASGKDKGELTEEDFIVVDEEGQPQGIAPAKPSAETLLHSTIYRHTGAKAVFHVHTTNSTLLSNSLILPPKARLGRFPDSPILSFNGLEMLKGLGFKTHDVKVQVPVIENSQDMKYLASIAPNYINEEVPGLLLKGHGIYGWGQSVQEAKRHVEIFEFLFEYRVKELSLTSRL